jgi:DNA-binding transcriptional MerR regulator
MNFTIPELCPHKHYTETGFMGQVEYMLEELQKLINSRFDRVEKKLDRMVKVKDVMDGDELLDNQDLCLLLGITKRSLATYRQKKMIPYYRADRKTYYRASDVKDFLKRKGKQPE